MFSIIQIYFVTLLFSLISKSCVSGLGINSGIEEIKEYNKKIKKWMNPNVDPCKNFMEYACGGFNENQEKIYYPASKDINAYSWIFGNESRLSPVEIEMKIFFINYTLHVQQPIKNVVERYNGLTWPMNKKNWYPPEDWLGEGRIQLFDKKSVFSFDYNQATIIHREKMNFTILIPGFNLFNELYEIKNVKEIERMKTMMKRLELNDATTDFLTNEIVEFSRQLFRDLKTCTFDDSGYLETTKIGLERKFPNINWDHLGKSDHSKPIFIFDSCRTQIYLKSISDNTRVAYNYLVWIKIVLSLQTHLTTDTFELFPCVVFAHYAQYSEISTKDIEKYERVLENIVKNVENYDNVDLDFLKNYLKKEKSFINHLSNLLTLNQINQNYKQLKATTNDIKGHEKELCTQDYELGDFNKFLTNVVLTKKKPMYTTFSNELATLLMLSKTTSRSGENDHGEYKWIRPLEKMIFVNEKSLESLTIPSAIDLEDSLKEYQKYLKKEDNLNLDSILSEIGINSMKAFYINFAQTYCPRSAYRKILALFSVINTKGFSEVFHCPVNSPMNKEKVLVYEP